MNKYLTLNSMWEIAEVLSKFYPYPVLDIFTEIKLHDSVDIAIKGIKLSLEKNISLTEACYLEKLK